MNYPIMKCALLGLLMLIVLRGAAQPVPQITLKNPELVQKIRHYIQESRNKGFLPDTLGIVVLSDDGRFDDRPLHLMAIRQAPPSIFKKQLIPAYYTLIDGALVLIRSGFEWGFQYPKAFHRAVAQLTQGYYTPKRGRVVAPKNIKEATTYIEGGIYNGTFIK
jgi:hypothetical protein